MSENPRHSRRRFLIQAAVAAAAGPAAGRHGRRRPAPRPAQASADQRAGQGARLRRRHQQDQRMPASQAGQRLPQLPVFTAATGACTLFAGFSVVAQGLVRGLGEEGLSLSRQPGPAAGARRRFSSPGTRRALESGLSTREGAALTVQILLSPSSLARPGGLGLGWPCGRPSSAASPTPSRAAPALARDIANAEARAELNGTLDPGWIPDCDQSRQRASPGRIPGRRTGGAHRRTAARPRRGAAQHQDAETRLRDTFRNTATQILDERAQKLTEQSQLQIGGLHRSAEARSSKEFREAIAQTYANEQRERGMLSQEIQTLKQLNSRSAKTRST